MNDNDFQSKCEWIHSMIQETQTGIEVDFDLMLELVEDIREHFLNKHTSEEVT